LNLNVFHSGAAKSKKINETMHNIEECNRTMTDFGFGFESYRSTKTVVSESVCAVLEIETKKIDDDDDD
jgi:hypothetical protein